MALFSTNATKNEVRMGHASYEWKQIYILTQEVCHSLPNNKILDVTKLKAFADNKLYVAKIPISHFGRVENTVGKGENAGYQHFLLFPQCFPKPSSTGSLKVGIVWERVNRNWYISSKAINKAHKGHSRQNLNKLSKSQKAIIHLWK